MVSIFFLLHVMFFCLFSCTLHLQVLEPITADLGCRWRTVTECGCVKRSRSTSADTQQSKDQLVEPVTAPQLHVRPLSPFKCAKRNYVILVTDYSFISVSVKLLYQHLGTLRIENGSEKEKRKVHLKRCGIIVFIAICILKICGVQLSECIHLVKGILLNSTSQHWQWVSVLQLHHGY